MKLHHKLMFMLAVFGLLPTLAAGWLGHDLLRQFNEALAAQEQRMRHARAEEHLRMAVAQAAAQINHRRTVAEVAVRVQAAAGERPLAQSQPAAPLPGLSVQTVPAAADPDSRPLRLTPGTRSPAAVPASPPYSTLAETFKVLRAALPTGFLWHSTAFENGGRIVYPEADDHPSTLGLRPGPWFRTATAAGDMTWGTTWSTPAVDTVAGRLVVTVSAPVYGPDGRPAGVTGVTVPTLDTLAPGETDPSLPPAGTTALLVVAERAASKDPVVRIIARAGEHADGDGGSLPVWHRTEEAEHLDATQDSRVAPLLAAVADDGSGVIRMPYAGTDALWAYAGLPSLNAALVYIAPLERASAGSIAFPSTVDAAVDRLGTTAGGIGAGLLILAVLGGYLGARSLTGRLTRLREALDRLGTGDMKVRAPVSGGDELTDVLLRFNAMVPALQKRMSRDWAADMTRDFRQALLPERTPVLPGFDIAGGVIGGTDGASDYFDYIPLRCDAFGRPRRLGVLVGHVAGRDVASALVLTTGRALLRSHAEGADEPGALLAAVNPLLNADARGGRFMAVFALFLTPGQRMAAWSSAGHAAALVVEPTTGTIQDLGGEDVPLGLDPDWLFAPSEARILDPGEVVVIGSDGLWDARDTRGTPFGRENVAHIVRTHRDADAATLCRAILDGVTAHREGASPQGDAALVVVKATA